MRRAPGQCGVNRWGAKHPVLDQCKLHRVQHLLQNTRYPPSYPTCTDREGKRMDWGRAPIYSGRIGPGLAITLDASDTVGMLELTQHV